MLDRSKHSDSIYLVERVLCIYKQKKLGSSVPGGTDSEEIQGWLLKFGENSTRLSTSVETFVDWLADGSLTWAVYCAFMSGWLIALEKQPGVRSVGVGETWRHIFSKIVRKVTGPEATMACQDDLLCAVLKVVIDSTIHGVKDIWDKNPSTEEWVFLLLDTKNAFNKINRV